MQIAILLFDGVSALDAVGPSEVLGRLTGADTVFVAEHRGVVRTDGDGPGLVADAALVEVGSPDVVVVPGGEGHRALLDDAAVHDWLRRADRTSTWTASVGTGALVLAAAGLLRGRRATTHWLALQDLAVLGAVPAAGPVVVDGKYATAAGVSAGIDLALRLAERIQGRTAAEAIQLCLQYDPQPPFAAGSPAAAPQPVVDTLVALRRFVLGAAVGDVGGGTGGRGVEDRRRI